MGLLNTYVNYIVCFDYFFVDVFVASTGQTAQPIFTLNGSNDAEWGEEVLLGVALTTNFIKGSVFLP
jgi:hypothetical protein